MASNKWEKFKNKVKNKRQKSEEKSNLESIIVQRLSAEVSGKAQKYTRVGAREFVPFIHEKLTIENIKSSCRTHYDSDLICDVLAGEQGPSCSSLTQLPDMKVIYVRFVEPEGKDDQGQSVSKSPPKKRIKTSDINYTKSCTNAVSSSTVDPRMLSQRKTVPVIPKSLSVMEMLKLGTLIDNTVQFLDLFEFDIDNMCWMPSKRYEFNISKEPFSSGGFRDVYRAHSVSKEFSGKSWVIKKYQKDAVTVIESMNQTLEQHTKKVVQMHQLARNLTSCMKRKSEEDDELDMFGETFEYNDIYLGRFDGSFVTMEEFIDGQFVKYINNDGTVNGTDDITISLKCESLVHYSYVKSKKEIMILDIQGCGYKLCDPEIASRKLKSDQHEFLYAAGNLSVCAIDNFLDHHKCNSYCDLFGLRC